MFLKQNDAAPYRQVILDSCLHNYAFDLQLEYNRSAYMFDIMSQDRPGWEFYRENIFQALESFSDNADDFDIWHVFELVKYLAEQGDQQAGSLIYRRFDEEPALGDFSGGRMIVLLDGVDGFIHAASRVGEHLLAHGEEFPIGDSIYFADRDLIWALEESIGNEAARTELERLRASNPSVAAYLAAVDEEKDSERPKEQKPDPQQVGYAEVRQMIDARTVCEFFLREWGKYASVDDLEQAAHDLVIETDTKRRISLLDIYRRATFPLDPDVLFPLALEEDGRLSVAAINALQNISHPSVRAFALQMIAEAHETGRMAGLLLNNFQEGDWGLIEALTLRALDTEDFHSLGFSIREIFEKHPGREAVGSLINLYDRGPCSLCRDHVIEHLHRLNAIPQWMYEECHYDADLDIRAKVKSYLED